MGGDVDKTIDLIVRSDNRGGFEPKIVVVETAECLFHGPRFNSAEKASAYAIQVWNDGLTANVKLYKEKNGL